MAASWEQVFALQWSHSLSAMETPIVNKPCHKLVRPSMEPQPFGHGNRWWEEGQFRGNAFLQWSHSLSAMETPW